MEASTPMEILKAGSMLTAIHGEAGYSTADGPAARSILRAPNPTARQVKSLWSILGKYISLLAALGVDYARLVPPDPAQEKIVPQADVRLAPVHTERGSEIAVLFQYDPKIVEAVKECRKRYFD